MLLLVRTGQEERQRPEFLDRDDQPGRGAYTADRLDGEADGEEVHADAAVLGRERETQDVVIGQELLDVPRELR